MVSAADPNAAPGAIPGVPTPDCGCARPGPSRRSAVTESTRQGDGPTSPCAPFRAIFSSRTQQLAAGPNTLVATESCFGRGGGGVAYLSIPLSPPAARVRGTSAPPALLDSDSGRTFRSPSAPAQRLTIAADNGGALGPAPLEASVALSIGVPAGAEPSGLRGSGRSRSLAAVQRQHMASQLSSWPCTAGDALCLRDAAGC